jgi:hypothetical protein
MPLVTREIAYRLSMGAQSDRLGDGAHGHTGRPRGCQEISAHVEVKRHQ